MVWKPKEKDLTPDEAIALARKELAPFWIGSEPLLAAIRHPEGISIFPLSPLFPQKPWLLAFADFTDLSIIEIAHYAREWQFRYSPHSLQILLVLKSRYTELRTPAAAAQQLKRLSLPFPAVIDQDGAISEGLKVSNIPFVSLLFQKKNIFSFGPEDWISKTELEIQNHLRQEDPGLPLPPPCLPDLKLVKPYGGIEFGRSSAAAFPGNGFQLRDDGLGAATFDEDISMVPRRGGRVFSICGGWVQDGDRIVTGDPSAGITFAPHGTGVWCVARSVSRERYPARVVVELNGRPALDLFCGSDLVLDEEGRSSAQVSEIGTYSMLGRLGPDAQRATFRFPDANRVPVALYGIRFAQDSLKPR